MAEVNVAAHDDLIDQTDSVMDEGTRGFLQSFIDQFAGLAARLSPAQARSCRLSPPTKELPCLYGQ